MRRVRPEVVVSSAALLVSVLTLISGTVWARGAAREDDLRAERRTAYADFTGIVARCSRWNDLVTRDDLSQSERDTLSATADEDAATCESEMSSSYAIVAMLADDQDVLNAGRDLVVTLIKAGSLRQRLARAESPGAPYPTPPTDPCGAGTPADLIDEFLACQFRIDTQRRAFADAARADVQERPPGLLEILVRVAPWLAVGFVVVAVGVTLLRRSRPPRSADPEVAETASVAPEA